MKKIIVAMIMMVLVGITSSAHATRVFRDSDPMFKKQPTTEVVEEGSADEEYILARVAGVNLVELNIGSAVKSTVFLALLISVCVFARKGLPAHLEKCKEAWKKIPSIR
jgi:hypothetical protein